MSKEFKIDRQRLKSHVLWRMINEMPNDCDQRNGDPADCKTMWRIIAGLPHSREQLRKEWQLVEYKCECIFCRDAQV